MKMADKSFSLAGESRSQTHGASFGIFVFCEKDFRRGKITRIAKGVSMQRNSFSQSSCYMSMFKMHCPRVMLIANMAEVFLRPLFYTVIHSIWNNRSACIHFRRLFWILQIKRIIYLQFSKLIKLILSLFCSRFSLQVCIKHLIQFQYNKVINYGV